MAQFLTPTCSASASAAQLAAHSLGPAIPGSDTDLSRKSRRAALSFRYVNRRGSPDYDSGLQRHHLLPRQLLSTRYFGAFFAAIDREWPGLDDFRSNGMLLPSSDAAALRVDLPLHRGPHRGYNAMVIERVGQIEADWSRLRRRAPQAASDSAIAALEVLQWALRFRLLNPGMKRLALNRSDPLGQGVDFADLDTMVDLLWPDGDSLVEHHAGNAQATTIPSLAIPVRAANLTFA